LDSTPATSSEVRVTVSPVGFQADRLLKDPLLNVVIRCDGDGYEMSKDAILHGRELVSCFKMCENSGAKTLAHFLASSVFVLLRTLRVLVAQYSRIKYI
jgi:hypothetical protein